MRPGKSPRGTVLKGLGRSQVPLRLRTRSLSREEVSDIVVEGQWGEDSCVLWTNVASCGELDSAMSRLYVEMKQIAMPPCDTSPSFVTLATAVRAYYAGSDVVVQENATTEVGRAEPQCSWTDESLEPLRYLGSLGQVHPVRRLTFDLIDSHEIVNITRCSRLSIWLRKR
jgi:hypothetical protein